MNGMSTALIFSRRGTIRHHAFSVTFDASFPSTGESIHKMFGANVVNDKNAPARETRGLQPRRDGGARSAWLAVHFIKFKNS